MIYLVEALGMDAFKIGYTADKRPDKRIATIQTGCPAKLVLLGTLRGGKKVENDLHYRFKDSRIRGEWFRFTHSTNEWLESLKHPAPNYTLSLGPAWKQRFGGVLCGCELCEHLATTYIGSYW